MTDDRQRRAWTRSADVRSMERSEAQNDLNIPVSVSVKQTLVQIVVNVGLPPSPLHKRGGGCC